MTTSLINNLALITTAAGIVTATVAWAVTRRHRPALPLLLDFLLAAGLLRLTADQSWAAIATTAVIVVLRKLTVTGIGQAAAARRRNPKDTAAG